MWTKEWLKIQQEAHLDGRLKGNYGIDVVKDIEEKIHNWLDVEGKHILVIGSQRPWIEVILLTAGAANITTLDYNTFDCDHPQIQMITPDQMSEMVLNATAPTFDAMVTFSSIEHSGLGR